MGVTNEMLATARRFAKWSEIQKQKEVAFGPAEIDMEARRRKFSGLQQLNVDPAIFLESVLEGNDLMPVRYFEMGKLASRAIGRIMFDLGPRTGYGFATGFLVAPGILLTNHHVLPSAEVAAAASVTFDAEDGMDGLPKRPHVFKLTPMRGYLSDQVLDFCFVSVSSMSTEDKPLADFGYLRLHQGVGKIMREEYATIIQHPRGRQKQVAARNNKITVYVYDRELTSQKDVDSNNHIYYETDTLPGSSGAPVFSDQWYVVALHRRGVPKTKVLPGAGAKNGKAAPGEIVALRHDGTTAKQGDPDESVKFVANEGVRVSRIVKRLEELALSTRLDERVAASTMLARIAETTALKDSGPFSVPVAFMNRLTEPVRSELSPSELELTRRNIHVFEDAIGFEDGFLGKRMRMPTLSRALQDAAAIRIDDPGNIYLPFHHFTTVMHAARRLPMLAAVNIGGNDINVSKKPARPQWSYDPRIDEGQQPDDSIFSSMVQRGHMAAREFMWWGTDEEARAADIHSFTLTNVCPQIGKFNGNLEWYQLERLIVKTAKDMKQRLNCFMGPIFSASDELYDDLRSDKSDATFGTGIKVPRKFWYLLVWKKGAKLVHRAFILDQSDDIEDVGPLEFDFAAPATVKEVSLAVLERQAKMTFDDLH